MSDINLTPYLKEKYAPFPRTPGRYHASELYRISRGWLKPEDWMKPRHFPNAVLMAMWNGELIHNYIQELLPDGDKEVKKVYLHKDSEFELVSKADWLPHDLDSVWEFKTSAKVLKKAKKEHLYQAKLYATLYNKSKGIVYQPRQDETGLYLVNIGEADRDDHWFKEQMQLLSEFHQSIKQIYA